MSGKEIRDMGLVDKVDKYCFACDTNGQNIKLKYVEQTKLIFSNYPPNDS